MLETEDWEEMALGKTRGRDSTRDWAYCKPVQDELPSHKAERGTKLCKSDKLSSLSVTALNLVDS